MATKKPITKKKVAPKVKLTSEGYAKKIMIRMRLDDLPYYEKILEVSGKKQFTDAILFAVKNMPIYKSEMEKLQLSLSRKTAQMLRIERAMRNKMHAENELLEALKPENVSKEEEDDDDY